jgi:hypothetical protein
LPSYPSLIGSPAFLGQAHGQKAWQTSFFGFKIEGFSEFRQEGLPGSPSSGNGWGLRMRAKLGGFFGAADHVCSVGVPGVSPRKTGPRLIVVGWPSNGRRFDG